ncbi:alpha/beta hydrolase [Streptomyces sp. NPDC002536]
MVTIDDLKNLDTSKFTKAADAWSSVSNRASSARDRVDHEMLGKLASTQEGDAATQALARIATLNKNYEYIHAECGLIRTALSCLAEELAAPQRKLKQALEDAEALKFTVKPDGSVEYPKSLRVPAPQLPSGASPGAMPSLLKPDSTPDPNAAKAQEVANRIGDALREAAEIDGRYARALTNLTTNGDLKNTDPSDVARDARGIRSVAGKHFSESSIPKGKSPKENAEWWNKLSQEERDEYAAVFPATIGKLDGLPSAVRDEANRIVLADTRISLSQQLADLVNNPPQHYEQKFNPVTGLPIQGEQQETYAWKQCLRKRETLEGQLRGIAAIQKRFDATGEEGLPEAYLLGFDADGLGRAIVANGNPDTAEHTAVYVPGTTARLRDAGKDIDKMTELWKQSHGMPGGPSVSTITWIGYDAPQSAFPTDKGDLVPEAASTSYADKAAPKLTNFLDGMRTAQGGPHASHTTVIGHSYGTTVVGDTSQKGGLGADDIIAVASPGMLVGHADDLDAPNGHVWSEAASLSKDQVPLGGRLVGLGGDSEITPLARVFPLTFPISSLTQNVPSDHEFGANIMRTDSQDHGGYWKDSDTLWNQAAVVTRNYDVVRRG